MFFSSYRKALPNITAACFLCFFKYFNSFTTTLISKQEEKKLDLPSISIVYRLRFPYTHSTNLLKPIHTTSAK